MATQRNHENVLESPPFSHPCAECQTPVFRPLMAGRVPVCPVCEAPWAMTGKEDAPGRESMAEVA